MTVALLGGAEIKNVSPMFANLTQPGGAGPNVAPVSDWTGLVPVRGRDTTIR
jgi:hypothetical protein